MTEDYSYAYDFWGRILRTGNLIYVRDTLRTILVGGGYVDVTYPSGAAQIPQYSYRWYITDYQGSTRAVIDSTGAILQMNLYYPYGYDIELPAPVYSGGQSGSQVQSGQDFKFSGKEQLTRTGLGWYDFGARWYDLGPVRAGEPVAPRPDAWADLNINFPPYATFSNGDTCGCGEDGAPRFRFDYPPADAPWVTVALDTHTPPLAGPDDVPPGNEINQTLWITEWP